MNHSFQCKAPHKCKNCALLWLWTWRRTQHQSQMKNMHNQWYRMHNTEKETTTRNSQPWLNLNAIVTGGSSWAQKSKSSVYMSSGKMNPTSNQYTYMSHLLQTQTLPRCKYFAVIVWGLAPMWVKVTNSFKRSNTSCSQNYFIVQPPKKANSENEGCFKVRSEQVWNETPVPAGR